VSRPLKLLEYFTSTHLCQEKQKWLEDLVCQWVNTVVQLWDEAFPLCWTKITKWQKYSQNTTIFVSYEWVDHIAVYSYMFRPLSAIVNLTMADRGRNM